jgi:hypothetical protein
MGSSLSNKLLVNVGSLVATNGAILPVSPGRFVQLRKTSLAPDAVDETLSRLMKRADLGRAIGATALALGVAMIAVGMCRTELPG